MVLLTEWDWLEVVAGQRLSWHDSVRIGVTGGLLWPASSNWRIVTSYVLWRHNIIYKLSPIIYVYCYCDTYTTSEPNRLSTFYNSTKFAYLAIISGMVSAHRLWPLHVDQWTKGLTWFIYTMYTEWGTACCSTRHACTVLACLRGQANMILSSTSRAAMYIKSSCFMHAWLRCDQDKVRLAH